MDSIKKRVQIYVLAIASINKILMNILGFNKCYLGNRFILTHIGTSVIYYVIVLVLLFGYLKSSLHRNWKSIALLSFSPVIFWVSFGVSVLCPVYIVSVAVVIFLTIIDIVCQCKKSRVLSNHRVKRRIIWNIICKNMGIGIVILGLSSMCLLTYMYAKERGQSISEKKHGELTYATNIRDLQSTTSEDLWENNKDILVYLSDQIFPQLNCEQKLFAYQCLLDIETSYLGIEPIQLAMKDTSGDNVAGYFSSQDQMIVMDEKYINCNSSYEGIGIILHEVHHFYAYECSENLQGIKDSGVNMNLLFARDIVQWEENQRNYYTPDDNSDPEEYYRYASQSLETAAEEYKRKWQDIYWEYINSIEFQGKLPVIE